MRSFLITLLILPLLSLVLACSKDPATSVQVIIDADQGIRDDADSLAIAVGGRAIGLEGWAPITDPIVANPTWPVRLSLAPFDELENREYQVVATATDGGSFLAEVSAESQYIKGETRELRLFLRSSCRGVMCSAPDSMTCVSGACVSNIVDPSSLDPYVPQDAGVLPPDDAGDDTSIDTGPVDGGPTDTDGDGYLDSEEGASTDRNTDGDAFPDYRDLDSDADGVPDALERDTGTSPTQADSDMDGASDMVEIALGTDPMAIADSPDARGLKVVVSPQGLSPEPSTTLVEEPPLDRPLDVYFLIESTGSMADSLAQVRSSITTGRMGSCMGGIIGAIRCRRSDLHTGIGIFGDYPVGSYGSPGVDNAYEHIKDVDADDAASRTAVNGITMGFGNDGAEAHLSALHAISTGDALHTYVPARMGCAGGRGYPCFRPTSVPVVVMITDSWMHDFPMSGQDYNPALLGFTPPTYMETITAMNTAAIRFVGVDVTNAGPANQVNQELTRIANDTSSADRAGFPWVRTIGDAMIPQTVVDLVRLAAQLSVSARVVDMDPSPPDATAAFVDRIVARTTPAGSCATGLMTEDRAGIDMDSFHETFFEVPDGQTLCWDLAAKRNVDVAQTEMPQVFMLEVQLADERLTEVAAQPVAVIVPPLDAGGV